VDSYIPSSNNAHNTAGLELKDNLERSSAQSASQQLVTITIRLVTLYLEVGKEALDRLTERHMMDGQLVAFEIVLKIGGRETLPVDHGRYPRRSEREDNFLLGYYTTAGVKRCVDWQQ
jgi:hypothetical protein